MRFRMKSMENGRHVAFACYIIHTSLGPRALYVMISEHSVTAALASNNTSKSEEIYKLKKTNRKLIAFYS